MSTSADPDDFYEDDLDDAEVTLDDFPDASIAQYAVENPGILFDACSTVAEDDPKTWDDIIDHASAAALVRGRVVSDAFEALTIFEQEEAWTRILEIARMRRLPLADLL